MPTEHLRPRPALAHLRTSGVAAALLGGITLARLALDPLLGNQVPSIVFAVLVVMTTWFCGVPAGIVNAIAAALMTNYLWVPPRLVLKFDVQSVTGMAVFGVTAAVLIAVASRWRSVEGALRRSERVLVQRNAELDAEQARWRGVVEGIADEVCVCDRAGSISLINLASVTPMGLAEFEGRTSRCRNAPARASMCSGVMSNSKRG